MAITAAVSGRRLSASRLKTSINMTPGVILIHVFNRLYKPIKLIGRGNLGHKF